MILPICKHHHSGFCDNRIQNVVIYANLDAHGKKLMNSFYKSYCIVFSTSVTTVNSFQICVMNSFNSARMYAELGCQVECEVSLVSCIAI